MSAPRDCFGLAPPAYVCRDRDCPYQSACAVEAFSLRKYLGPFVPTVRAGKRAALPRRASHMAGVANRR